MFSVEKVIESKKRLALSDYMDKLLSCREVDVLLCLSSQ